MSLSVQFNAVVVCDDVRKEQSGKDILIGVYGSLIQIHALPSAMNLAFWMEITAKKQGINQIHFRILFPNPEQKIEFGVRVEITDIKIPFGMFTPQFPCTIDREGQIRLYARTAETEKFELIKIRDVKYVPAGETAQVKEKPVPAA
jgi:hypothetical protein